MVGFHHENPGKIMGKSWEKWENHGKIMGKSWENHGKIGKSYVFEGFEEFVP